MINETKIYVLIRHWNSDKNLSRCISSVFKQKYKNYTILFVDDASIKNNRLKEKLKSILSNHVCVFNKERKYSLRNAYEMITKYAKDEDAIIFNLDADDWICSAHAFSKINLIYRKERCLYTYGNNKLYDGKKFYKNFKKKYTENTEYPQSYIQNRKVRTYPFLPLHPRTWKVSLFKLIPKSRFMRNNSWIRFCEDMAIFFPFFEIAPNSYHVLADEIYVYNTGNPTNDLNNNTIQLMKDEIFLRKQEPMKQIFP